MVNKSLSIYIGFDYREPIAYDVCKYTINRYCPSAIVHPLKIDQLTTKGLINRPIIKTDGQMWDVISDKPQATEFAISRFLVPIIHQSGWAIFMDCDMVLLDDFNKIIPLLDDSKAVMCVKHNHQPTETIKMDNQIQTQYPRKNWSSVIAFNCDHPANKQLSIEDINSKPGFWFHTFSWLKDEEIGELPRGWNWLVNVQPLPSETYIAHFTLGGPWFDNWKAQPHDELWNMYLKDYINAKV